MINDIYDGERDAETLMDAERIKKDPKRLKAAQKAASRMVAKKEEELKAMKSVERSGGFENREEQKSSGFGSTPVTTGKPSDFGTFKRII